MDIESTWIDKVVTSLAVALVVGVASYIIKLDDKVDQLDKIQDKGAVHVSDLQNNTDTLEDHETRIRTLESKP